MEACKICNNVFNNKTYLVKEQMFGLPEEFTYVECGQCGCLQLTDIPEDMGKYYPLNYYSFNNAGKKENRISLFLKKKRAEHFLYRKNFWGWLSGLKYGYPPYCEWFKIAGVTFNSSILDVGSGSGKLIIDLGKAGYKNLTGIDPFIEKDIHYTDHVKILKRKIEEVSDSYELIMLNHAFEHMDNPLKVLKDIRNILSDKGILLIRIPTASSFAWRTYKENWVQLDSPRHIFLHTIESMKILSQETGFTIKEIKFDSSDFQFIGSEQYKMGIPLIHEKSFLKGNKLFTKEELAKFKMQAKELNNKNDGDSVCFYLAKSSSVIPES
jgi:2-polyprenyl-3-methyl-5-hydroxy-6-metoxy-1,4-benzoquinol methylase